MYIFLLLINNAKLKKNLWRTAEFGYQLILRIKIIWRQVRVCSPSLTSIDVNSCEDPKQAK